MRRPCATTLPARTSVTSSGPGDDVDVRTTTCPVPAGTCCGVPVQAWPPPAGTTVKKPAGPTRLPPSSG